MAFQGSKKYRVSPQKYRRNFTINFFFLDLKAGHYLVLLRFSGVVLPKKMMKSWNMTTFIKQDNEDAQKNTLKRLVFCG